MFLDGFNSETRRINKIIKQNAFDESYFYEREIRDFMSSPKRRDMLTGEEYYRGEQEILRRKRTVIGEGGKITEVTNLPNHRIVDNQYARLVDQKVNYLLSKPITYCCEDRELLKEVRKILSGGFERTLKAVGEDGLNGGIGWLYVFINEEGRLDFMRFKPFEVIPIWADRDHTRLDSAVRLYSEYSYRGRERRLIKKADIYKKDSFSTFLIENGRLIPQGGEKGYISSGENKRLSWGRVPVIGFKQNNKEIPLIKKVKALQDGLNEMRSDFLNNMQEDKRNTILVIKNYDGTDLGEFRRNLSQYGAVKVRTIDGAEGGIDTLSVEVSCENYEAVCDMLKKAITENGRGLDTRDERFNSNPNQMNILSIYSDIDLDANGMENEYQASFSDIFYFVKKYLAMKGMRGLENKEIKAIFNRDQMINEAEIIDCCVKSRDIISEESVIAQHPWVEDVYDEIRKKESEAGSNGVV